MVKPNIVFDFDTSVAQTPVTLCVKCETNGDPDVNTTITYEVLNACNQYVTVAAVPSPVVYTDNPASLLGQTV